MSPCLLGCKAVTVRSFGRIHETNLKKGLIPLAFSDPDGYAKVLEVDTISVTGLANLRPVQPVRRSSIASRAATRRSSSGTR